MTATAPTSALLCRFTLAGIPRTKKTSNRIIHIKGKDGGRSFSKIMPSEVFEEWLAGVVSQGPHIRFAIEKAGLRLPIEGPVWVRMLVYRDRLSGDLNGFEQAVTDAIQTSLLRAKCARCQEATTARVAPPACPKCGAVMKDWKQIRKGIGIICDDKQVQSKDGSRLLKDSARPRVEVEIREFTEFAVQGGLALEEEF